MRSPGVRSAPRYDRRTMQAGAGCRVDHLIMSFIKEKGCSNLQQSLLSLIVIVELVLDNARQATDPIRKILKVEWFKQRVDASHLVEKMIQIDRVDIG